MNVAESHKPGELVTQYEAAKIAGVSYRTIIRYADQGILTRLVNPTGQTRFNRADVVALITFTPVATTDQVTS